MKKVRIIALMLVATLCCALLSGCMGTVVEVKVNADGSGTMVMSAGMTKDGLAAMQGLESSDGLDLTGYTPFEYNGVTYYGTVETSKFATVEEFNNLMKGEELEESTNGVDSGELTLSRNSDGSFTLTLIATAETGDTTEMEESAEAQEIDPKMIEEMLAEFAIVQSFEFPTEVKQIAGPTGGVTIKGNKVTMDLMKLDTIESGEVKYVFTTGKVDESQVVKHHVKFKDVSEKAWYYDAVTAMADGGLVLGIGNDLFNPEGVLTYAQFCQILARAKFLETGSKNGYWAYYAVESCIEAGYILDRGEITPKNYDVPITREAAVAAMFKGKQAELFLPVNNLTKNDIPDFDKISEVFKEDILNAYRYGITNGMDSNRTFGPNGQLTRAQVCQLFYNLDWTNPLQDVDSITPGIAGMDNAGSN